MSLISPSRCLPAALIFWRSGMKRLLVEVFGLLLEHLGVADDRVQRRPQLVGHVGQEGALVPGRLFERAVEAGVVDRQGRLGREGLEQGDDLGRERARRPPRHDQPAEDAVLAQERDGQHRVQALREQPIADLGGEHVRVRDSSTWTARASRAARPTAPSPRWKRAAWSAAARSSVIWSAARTSKTPSSSSYS